MKRIQIYIDDALDAAARREAKRRGISRSEFIRSCVAAEVEAQPSVGDDPWADMVGWLEGEPVDDIDAVIYKG